ncbi:zf-HC2 domain-containing protein [Streptomyces sp. NPDC002851]
MSGSRRNPAEQHLAEQHLGDRLAALVDGELGHDTRERVLAHLATCPKCKAEADAQRRLKTYFASTAPPGPSESFLARLQELPGGGDDDSTGTFASGLADTVFEPEADGVFTRRRGTFGLGPSGAPGGMLPGGARERGFRIHEVGRTDAGRTAQERAAASRGRRFAFAAAGAVSLAAIALGGVTTGTPIPADTGAESRGSKAAPQRGPNASGGTAADPGRRRSAGRGSTTDTVGAFGLTGAQRSGPGTGSTPMSITGTAPPGMPGPVLPGLAPQGPGLLGSGTHLPGGSGPDPGTAPGGAQEPRAPGSSPLLSGATALSPLIRPPAGSPQYPAPGLGGRPGQATAPSTSPLLPQPPTDASFPSGR